MIDSNGNGHTTSIPTAAARRETGGVAPTLITRYSSGVRSAVRAHPYLAAAGIVTVFGLVLTGGLLAGSYRRRSWSDVFTRWF